MLGEIFEPKFLQQYCLTPHHRNDWAPANFFTNLGRTQGSCTLWFQDYCSSTGSSTSAATAVTSAAGSSATGSTASLSSGSVSESASESASAQQGQCQQGSSNKQLSKPLHLFQTWNPLTQPAPGSVLLRYSFERPLVTLATADAVKALWQAQGVGGVWFVGAYSLLTIPLQVGNWGLLGSICLCLV